MRLVIICAILPFITFALSALAIVEELSMTEKLDTLARYSIPTNNSLGCIAFSPETGPYSPMNGDVVPSDHVDKLLDALVSQSNFQCIATYRVTNGNDYVTPAAKARGLKVILGIWIDGDSVAETNNNINRGIELAKQYEDTVIGVSCGSEMRVRHSKEIAERMTFDCINRVRAAGVKQPIGVRDLWFDWCDAQTPCAQWSTMSGKVDWIGVNIFPFWENWFTRTCITPEETPQFHLTIYQQMQSIYPDKMIMVTEFGWPGGGTFQYPNLDPPPVGCADTTDENQQIVVRETLKVFRDNKVPCVLFQAFRSKWKANQEGTVGAYWGLCEGEASMNCTFPIIGIPNVNPGDSDIPPSPSPGGDGRGGGGDGGNGKNRDGNDSNATTDTAHGLLIALVMLLCAIIVTIVQ